MHNFVLNKKINITVISVAPKARFELKVRKILAE